VIIYCHTLPSPQSPVPRPHPPTNIKTDSPKDRYFLRFLHEKSVLTVTILLRKVARCILGTRNLVLTLLRRQHEQRFLRPALWEGLVFFQNDEVGV
jgi:hypothetical protein